MFNRTFTRILLLFHLGIFAAADSKAQCTSYINWDNLDYLTTAGTYTPWVTNAMSQTQNFSFGKNRLTMAVSNAGANWTIGGENTAHTGEAGSYGTGADVQFTTTVVAARTLTLTFDTDVSTFKMSLYDIDAGQRVAVTATNALGVAQSITLTKPGGGTVTIAGSPGVAPTGLGNVANYANNVTTGTLNIDIAGPVKTIVLSFSIAAGDFWVSDINAVTPNCFTNGYWSAAKPFTGQNANVLIVVDNNVYYTDVVTGASTLLFTDASWTNLNSIGYDPVNGFVYYTFTLTGSPSTDKALKRYDVNTGTMSTVIADLTTLGIPLFENGVEVGAGAFYDGSYYLGVEAYNTGVATGRKSTIWRVDFNSSFVPYRASQTFAIPVDVGTTIVHDWGDFGMSNGILYDFDAASGGNDDFYHYNMVTGALTQYNPSGGAVSQTSIGWNEQLYNINGNIATYNNGVIGAQTPITGTVGVRWGDAGEAYRPPVDFGDAPATYDPAASDPAVHLASQSTLRIGAQVNNEASKRGTTSTEDLYDDGISTVSYLLPGVANYLVSVNVYNNTGSNATLNAWLDYNGNGVFNPGEGITQVVASSAGVQSKWLFWSNINTTIASGNYTYLRVRLTSTTNGMTTSNPTGYYNNGEVEDYRVTVDNYPLSSPLFTFNAKRRSDGSVRLDWSVNEQGNPVSYELHRSKDGVDWMLLGNVSGGLSLGTKDYYYGDPNPLPNTSYYRLSWIDGTGARVYSQVKSITFTDLSELVSVSPNPVIDKANVNIFNTGSQTLAEIKVFGMQGNELLRKDATIRSGANTIEVAVDSSWPRGIYTVQVTVKGRTVSKKILIRR